MLVQKGFTFVELLVVISIMAVMAVVSFARFATLKEEQTLKVAVNQLQSFVRTAQTNATTGVKCSNVSTDVSGTWFVEFRDSKNVDLGCYILEPDSPTLKKTLTFENNQPSLDSITGITGSNNCSTSFPGFVIRVSFAPLNGKITFTDKNPAASSSCLDENSDLSINLKKASNIKSLIISRGGSIEIK